MSIKINGVPSLHPRSFWSSLTEREQWDFNASAKCTAFEAGSVLCREGDIADNVMVIQSGWTKICTTGAGRERILAVRGVGDLIGERAVLRVRSRSATVIALSHGQTRLMTAADFAGFLESHPRVLAVLDRQLYDRLTEERGPAFTDEPVENRLASLILELALRHGLDGGSLPALTLPISQSDLANWAGVPEKAVSQILASWCGKRLIRISDCRITIVDIRALIRMYGQPMPHPPVGPTRTSPSAWSGQNCSILLTDIAGFGAHNRDDQDRRVVRGQMYEFLHDALASSNVPSVSIHVEDRGDGALIVVPPSFPTASVMDPMLTRLAASLRRHNHQASDAVRIQLRLALDVGPVFPDSEGVSGESIIRAARLLDAPVLKKRLASTAADLGVIVSTFVYDNVVKHAPGSVDPAGFQQVRCRVKESEITAWMHLAGFARAPARRQPGPTSPRPWDRQRSTGPIFNGDVRVEGDLVLGSKIHYSGRAE